MKAIILAAGEGKRMRSATHKMLHPLMGKPLLHYVIDACVEAGVFETVVVIGQQGETVREQTLYNVNFAWQDAPLGTGHAVMAAQPHIKPDDDVLILCGDTPLITGDFIKQLAAFQAQNEADAILVSVSSPEPYGLGRVYMEGDKFVKIVEQKDLNPADPPNNCVNTGVYLFKGEALLYGLARITNDNNQQEYYLTDVPYVLQRDGRTVKVFQADDHTLFYGINSQSQLADAVSLMRQRINRRHMDNGVRMIDPASTFIDGGVVIEADVTLYPGVILEGACHIKSGSSVGPNTRLMNTVLEEHVTVQYSVLSDTAVGEGTTIGPFAYLRNGAVIGENCRIGNFVEIKNSHVGNETKAVHLTYIGDAEVGDRVNFGCGVITGNYDGVKKHRTTIGNEVFIGCNSNLIAPVTLNDHSFVAAGSTITDDVPSETLAIARARQVNKPNCNRKS